MLAPRGPMRWRASPGRPEPSRTARIWCRTGMWLRVRCWRSPLLRAAGEMRSRLRAMDTGSGAPVGTVQAFTALRRRAPSTAVFWPCGRHHPLGTGLDSKFKRRRDGREPMPPLASNPTTSAIRREIEWAKASLISVRGLPGGGRRSLSRHSARRGEGPAVYTYYEKAEGRPATASRL